MHRNGQQAVSTPASGGMGCPRCYRFAAYSLEDAAANARPTLPAPMIRHACGWACAPPCIPRCLFLSNGYPSVSSWLALNAPLDLIAPEIMAGWLIGTKTRLCRACHRPSAVDAEE
jgi:hypothetical protein